MPVIIPAQVRCHPLFNRYPLLVAAGNGPIRHPINEDLIVQAVTLQVEILASPSATENERKAVLKLVKELSAPDLQLPAAAPAWAQLIMQGLQVIRDDVADLRDDASSRLDRIEGTLGQVAHANQQLQSFQINNALSSFGLPLQPVQPLQDANGQLPPLPNAFNGTTLASLTRLLVADLDMALAAYGIVLPPGHHFTREEKARLLFRRLGGLPSVTKG